MQYIYILDIFDNLELNPGESSGKQCMIGAWVTD